jgi:hypothetical protein
MQVQPLNVGELVVLSHAAVLRYDTKYNGDEMKIRKARMDARVQVNRVLKITTLMIACLAICKSGSAQADSAVVLTGALRDARFFVQWGPTVQVAINNAFAACHSEHRPNCRLAMTSNPDSSGYGAIWGSRNSAGVFNAGAVTSAASPELAESTALQNCSDATGPRGRCKIVLRWEDRSHTVTARSTHGQGEAQSEPPSAVDSRTWHYENDSGSDRGGSMELDGSHNNLVFK